MLADAGIVECGVTCVGLRMDVGAGGQQDLADGQIAVLGGIVERHEITRLTCIDVSTSGHQQTYECHTIGRSGRVDGSDLEGVVGGLIDVRTSVNTARCYSNCAEKTRQPEHLEAVATECVDACGRVLEVALEISAPIEGCCGEGVNE